MANLVRASYLSIETNGKAGFCGTPPGAHGARVGPRWIPTVPMVADLVWARYLSIETNGNRLDKRANTIGHHSVFQIVFARSTNRFFSQ